MPADIEPPRFRVELCLIADAEPIRGTVHIPDGAGHPFSGWLELIQILDQASRVNRVEQ